MSIITLKSFVKFLLSKSEKLQFVQFQFGVAKFDKNKLKTVETVEKNVLPSADDIKEEKSH